MKRLILVSLMSGMLFGQVVCVDNVVHVGAVTEWSWQECAKGAREQSLCAVGRGLLWGASAAVIGSALCVIDAALYNAFINPGTMDYSQRCHHVLKGAAVLGAFGFASGYLVQSLDDLYNAGLRVGKYAYNHTQEKGDAALAARHCGTFASAAAVLGLAGYGLNKLAK